MAFLPQGLRNQTLTIEMPNRSPTESPTWNCNRLLVMTKEFHRKDRLKCRTAFKHLEHESISALPAIPGFLHRISYNFCCRCQNNHIGSFQPNSSMPNSRSTSDLYPTIFFTQTIPDSFQRSLMQLCFSYSTHH